MKKEMISQIYKLLQETENTAEYVKDLTKLENDPLYLEFQELLTGLIGVSCRILMKRHHELREGLDPSIRAVKAIMGRQSVTTNPSFSSDDISDFSFKDDDLREIYC